MEEIISKTHCVVHDSLSNHASGTGGDSGSFVLSMRGDFVGLYLGGSDTAGPGFFTCADDLIGDIKSITAAVDVRFDFGG